MAIAWDANAYEQVASVQEKWGRDLIASRTWRGDEVVLDAGCGPGVLAEVLLGKVPRGRVVAVDLDASMVAAARRRLAPHGARAEVHQADLQKLPRVGPFDVIFSNAVLHWIPDHDEVFSHFIKVLRPGGDLIAQAGGVGNLRRVRAIARQLQIEAPFEASFRSWREPWNNEDADPTTERLLIYGFVHPRVTLTPAPTTFPDDATLKQFLTAVVFRPYLEALATPELRQRFVDEYVRRAAQDGLGRTLDYVRLTIRASHPPNVS